MIDSKDNEREPTFETVDDLTNRASALLSRLQEREQELTSYMERMRGTFEEASRNLEQADTARRSADDTREEVDRLKQSMDQERSAISGLAEQGRTLLGELETRQRQLETLLEEATTLRAQIEAMLPAATSAGLAAPFRERRQSFRTPRRVWGSIFVLAVLSLVPIGYIDPLTLERVAIDADTLVSHLVQRLPVLVPVIALAVYAAIRHRQAMRLEEEYAHKEALSRSFEGYRRVLGEIEEESPQKTHTLQLIQRTLEALGRDPGRIFGHRSGRVPPTEPGPDSASREQRRDGGDGA